MTSTRKIQHNKHLDMFFCCIPRQLVDALDLKKGDALQFKIVDGNLMIIPEGRP